MVEEVNGYSIADGGRKIPLASAVRVYLQFISLVPFPDVSENASIGAYALSWLLHEYGFDVDRLTENYVTYLVTGPDHLDAQTLDLYDHLRN